MNISLTEPVNLAIERMKRMLFRPFDFAKWVYLGFTAWLAGLTEGGGGNFRLPSDLGDLNKTGVKKIGEEPFRDIFAELEKLDLILVLGVVAGVVFLILAFSLLLTWLSSRGSFMFLDNAVRDRAEVKQPWREYRIQGNSLFVWRYVFGLVSFFVFLFLILAVVLGFLQQAEMVPGFVSRAVKLPLISWAALVTLISLTGLLFLALLYIYLFLDDFVVPIMAGFGLQTNAAWGKFLELFRAHTGSFLLYGIFKAVLNIAVALMLIFVIILTCCIAGCLMVIPVVGSIFLLPVSLSFRLYSVFYLAQFGSDFDLLSWAAGGGGGAAFDEPRSTFSGDAPATDMGDNPYYPYR